MKSGVYHIAPSTTVANAPSDVTWLYNDYVLVFNAGQSNQVLQVFVEMLESDAKLPVHIHMRTNYGAWGSWVRML